MAEEIVGSNFKAQRGRGQNQDASPSSVTAKSFAQIPNVSPPNAVVPGIDHQDTLEFIKGGPADPPHMNNEHPRTSDTGSPGGKVPSNDRPVTKQI